MAPPRLLVTIDVEEDMPDWGIGDPITVANVAGLQRVADLCTRSGLRPTYLCTYPVATLPDSVAILRRLHARGDCEIGTHLHAWNTPPFLGVPGRRGDERSVAYYQYELGPERFRAKLAVLHAAVGELTGAAPRSFRAGRFGIDAPTLRELIPLGYEVDSSVTPLDEHRIDRGPDFRNAPQHPYRPSHDDVGVPGDLPIVEIPVSVGLSRRLPLALQRAYVRIPRFSHLRGLLSSDFLNWVDFGWLYPVRFELDVMSKVARNLVRDGAPVLNVFVHSSELVAKQSGRVHTQADVELVYTRLEGILEYCAKELDARPCTLHEAALSLQSGLGITRR